MTAEKKMHPDEILASPVRVHQLLKDQMPQWADLSISELPLGGTDNALYRLGGDMLVRLPRIGWAVAAIAKEQEWLPRLAPLLPIDIPAPLALGEPGNGYPWPWSVYRWLEGEDPSINLDINREALVQDIIEFIEALRRVALPRSPEARSGLPLRPRDKLARQKIDALGNRIDRHAALAVWEEALAASEWEDDPVWVHADLDARNVLVEDGRLNAVLDWGCAGLGDPAFDIAVAWKLFSTPARETFRARLEVEEATWNRARGWTLLQALNALTYYTVETNPVLVQENERWLGELLGSTTEP